MNHRPNPEVNLCEVGPRDGLQSIATLMPTADKVRWIQALFSAGFRDIEVGSFVPPKIMPQMADIDAVVAESIKIKGLTVTALVPNWQGAERAAKAGVHKISLPLSVSASHSLANVRKTPSAMLEEVRTIVAWNRDQTNPMVIEVGLSTAFGCTIEGAIAESAVLRLAEQVAEAGVSTVALSDTTGMGNPAQVKRLFQQLIAHLGDKAGAGHFHNTRGLGLANCLAAFEVGVRAFDSSQGGIGGCPYAPGASGNVVSEDLVFMFESMGVATGINLPTLIAARQILAESLPNEPLYGMTPLAGLPKNFHPH